MDALVWSVVGFVSGSLTFSLWVGQLALGKDIRCYGDGNPGAVNVLRAGGRGWGILALLLDYLKGAVPVYVAHAVVGVDGWALVPVGLAPVLGHAFSPLLALQGGKAVTVTFGVWTGLALWQGPTVLGGFLTLWTRVLLDDEWAVILSGAGLLAYLCLLRPDPVLLTAALGNILILAVKHRTGLRRLPRFKRGVAVCRWS